MPTIKKQLTWEQVKNGFSVVLIYLRPYRRTVIILIILSIISAIFNAVIPFLAGKIVDTLITHSFKSTALILGGWALIQIVENILKWQRDRHNTNLSAILYSDFLVDAYSKLLRLPMQFHKSHKMGEVADRLSRTANWLERIIDSVVIDLAPQFLSIIIVAGIAITLNPKLALILFAMLAIYIFITIRVAPRLSGLQTKMNRAFGDSFGDAYDAILNTSAVKQAVTEAHENKKLFKNFRLRATKLWLNLRAISQILNFYQRIIITLTQLLVFFASIFLIQKGEITVGELVTFNGYAAMIFGPFAQLARNWETIQNGLNAIQRGQKIIEMPPEIYAPENAPILDSIRGDVAFKNVSFGYNKGQLIINDINIHIRSGEIVALVGESGVGKSTLIDLISGYFFPKKGKVLIDGHDVRTLDLKFLRSQIAIVPQEIILFNDTVKNNIRYGNFLASGKEVMEAAKKAHAHDFIEKFPKKYNQIVGERGIKLSSGQKQRIAIARAILRNPKILILDEPTSALDAQSEQYVTQALEELMHGRTTFIIAHRLATVRKANRILVLRNGSIAEEGTHDKLITLPEGIYRNLYELQRL